MNNQNYTYIKNNIIIFSIIIFFIFFNIWDIYPLYPSEIFQDWLYIYDYRYCKNGMIVLSKNHCLNILSNEFVYSKIWLNVAALTSDRDVFKLLIIPFIFLYIYLINYLLKNNLSLSLLFLFSPVSILLIHRANNDLIIFMLIYLFYILLIKYHNKYFFLLPLIAATKAKIYPIVLITILAVNKKINKNFKIYMFFLLLFIFLIIYSEIFEILNYYNKSGVTLSFSSKVIFKIFSFVTNHNLNYNFLSICSLLLIFLFAIFSNFEIPSGRYDYEISYLIGSSIVVSSFFLNEGFVYKLIFLIFTFPLIMQYKKNNNLRLYNCLMVITLLALWCEFLSFSIEVILNIDHFYPKNNPMLNFKNFIYGLSVILKNFIYWLLNISLILISFKIIKKNI